MPKRSHKPSMKVMENLNNYGMEAVLHILNVTSRIKDYAFQINRLLQTEVKRRKIQVKKQKNAKFMALQCQIESSQQGQTRLQDISAQKAICSQFT